MLKYVVGDLFTSPAKVLVNTVNTVGVMGKGIALDFKRVYPDMFKQYQVYCVTGKFDIGQLWLYKTQHKWILNFPTKRHWRNRSKLEYLEAGLRKFADSYDAKGIVSISFPMLGCGNGELDWKQDVQPLMERYLQPLPIEIFVHLYRQNGRFLPEHRDIAAISEWVRTEPQNLPFTEFWEDVVAAAISDFQFRAFDTNALFKLRYVQSTETLVIRHNSQLSFIHRESFEQLWAAIRAVGFFRLRDLPEEMSEIAVPVASLLSRLPYLELVLISSNSDVSDQDVGLKLRAAQGSVTVEQLRVKSA